MKKKILQIIIVASLIVGAKSAVFGQGTWVIDSSTGFLARRSFSSEVIGSEIYIIGGVLNGALQIFDPIMHTWRTPSTTGSSGGEKSALINGKIYAVGEEFATSRDSAIFIFDPSTNVWSQPTTYGTFTWRQDFTCAVVDNKIYTIGGEGNINGHDTVLNTLEVFDPSSNSWSTPVTTGKLTARAGLTSSVVNGKIYIIGGDDSTGYPCNTLEVFDPSTNNWSTPVTTGTFTARAYLTSSVVNNKIYVVGGDLGGRIKPTGIMDIFDLSTNSWNSGSSMPTAREELSSAVVKGKIYALGGYTPHQELNTVEVFMPAVSSVTSGALFTNFVSLESYPEPTSYQTTLFFTLPEAGRESLTLADAAGRETTLLHSVWLNAGQHEVVWDASKYPSGVYLCRLEAGGDVVTKKLIVRH